MKKVISMFLLMLFAVVLISAQPQIPEPGVIIDGIKEAESWTDLVSLEVGIYTILITVGGWFSAFIPGLRNIESGVFRVLTWAILIIAGGVTLGFSNIWVGAVSYFFSTSLYEVVIKWLIKTPKPSEIAT